MVTIPVLRSRVAPVLDWCSRMRIFPVDPVYEVEEQEISLPDLEAGQRLQILREKGVTIIICGALSGGLLHYANQLNIKVICGVAGELIEVIHSFWHGQLDDPQFWLPGCQGRRCYGSQIYSRLGGCPRKGKGKIPRDKMRRTRQGHPEERAFRDICLCPACGTTFPHRRGSFCPEQRCSLCGCHLVRQ